MAAEAAALDHAKRIRAVLADLASATLPGAQERLQQLAEASLGEALRGPLRGERRGASEQDARAGGCVRGRLCASVVCMCSVA